MNASFVFGSKAEIFLVECDRENVSFSAEVWKEKRERGKEKQIKFFSLSQCSPKDVCSLFLSSHGCFSADFLENSTSVVDGSP